MLKATIRNGTIVPLEPLPPEWGDGTEVQVELVRDEVMTPDEIIRSFAVLEQLCSAENPDDFERLEAAIHEMDRQEKARIRREWSQST